MLLIAAVADAYCYAHALIQACAGIRAAPPIIAAKARQYEVTLMRQRAPDMYAA